MNILVIGDLHGDMNDWAKFRKQHVLTAQLGDLGCGFVPLLPVEEGHYFIRGNHDSPEVARSRPDYLGDYGVFKGNIFFASGAASIDRDQRTPGLDWWAEEELSEDAMQDAARVYAKTRPAIVLTHCAPASVESKIGAAWRGSKTSHWLQRLLELHIPDVWVFGHYHEAHEINLGATRFICVAKNTARFLSR